MRRPNSLTEPLEPRCLHAAVVADRTFGANGSTTLSVPAGAGRQAIVTQLAADTAGRVVVAMRTRSTLVLRRLRPDGTADAAFNASPAANAMAATGAVGDDADRPRIATDAVNRLYLLNGRQLVRFSPSGRVDRTFGRRGGVTLPAFARTADVKIATDGACWVVGTSAGSNGGTRMLVARVDPAGVPDAAFAPGGVYTATPGVTSLGEDGDGVGSQLRVLPGGDIIAAGRGTEDHGSGVRFGAVQGVRFDRLGRLRRAYGDRGVGVVAGGYGLFYRERFYVAAIGREGSIVAGAQSDEGGAYHRMIGGSGEEHDGEITIAGVTVTRPGELITGPDNVDYFVGPTTLFPVSADNVADAGIHVRNNYIAGTQAAAVGPDGRLLIAGTGSSAADARVTVARLAIPPAVADGYGPRKAALFSDTTIASAVLKG